MSCNHLSSDFKMNFCNLQTKLCTEVLPEFADISQFLQKKAAHLPAHEKVKSLWDLGVSFCYLFSLKDLPRSLEKLKQRVHSKDFAKIAHEALKVAKLASDVLIGLEGCALASLSSTQKEMLYETNLALVVSIAMMELATKKEEGYSLKKTSRMLLASIPVANEVLGSAVKDLAIKTAFAASSVCSFLHKSKTKCGC